MKKFTNIFAKTAALVLAVLLLLTGCTDSDVDTILSLAEQYTQQQTEIGSAADSTQNLTQPADEVEPISESGTYTTPEDVALYLHTYSHLPDNFITKRDAQALGWDSSAGNLQTVAPNKSIGGDYFGNYEGLLPAVDGREYRECDVNYTGGYRGAERIIYSNDGLIYYTNDHYESFTQLYGEE